MHKHFLHKGRTIIEKIGIFALDTIAPPDPVVRRIEGMNWEDFIKAIRTDGSDPLHTSHDKPTENMRAILPYKHPLVKTAILEVKSYGNKKLARLLGSLLYEHLTAELAPPTPPTISPLTSHTKNRILILPIPITKKSRRARGWNQCELITDILHTCDTEKRYEVRTDILFKHRETADQVGKNRTERFENLRNCFMVRNPALVHDRTVIVFDDILTTGATLGEAVETLYSAGAHSVIPIALAH